MRVRCRPPRMMRSGLRMLTRPARPRPRRSIRASAAVRTAGSVYWVRSRSLACWSRETSGPGVRPASMSRASGSASTSRQPRLPQWQGRPSGLTVRWPTSRASPELPVCRRPSRTRAPPTPRCPVATHSRSRAPRPAPCRCSASAARLTSLPAKAGPVMPAARTHSAKIRRTGAPTGHARWSGLRARPSGSATADGTASPAPTQRRPVVRRSSAPASTTEPSTLAGSASTASRVGAVATMRPPRPTSAARKPSAWTCAASATGPSSATSSRCEGRPWEPAAAPGRASTRISPSASSSAATAPAVARVTPSSEVSTARVGARPVCTSSSAGPSAPRPRSSRALEVVVPSPAVRGSALPLMRASLP